MGGARRPAGRASVAARAGAWPTATAGVDVLVLVLAVVYFWLAALAHLTPRHILVAGTLIVAFGGVGLVVAHRQPRNRLGWILLGWLFLVGLGGIAGPYAVLDYRLGHHGLPLGPAAVVLNNSVQLLALLLAPLIILLFPDGYLPGPRWRWVVWTYAGLVACVMTVAVANAIAPVADHDIRLDSSGNLASSGHLPGWLANPPAWIDAVVLVGLAGFVLAGVGLQVLSWRRATGERRQQLKWLVVRRRGHRRVADRHAFRFKPAHCRISGSLPVGMGVANLRSIQAL